jgi:hypothetical protein
LHVTDLNIVTPKPIIQPIYEQSHLIVVTRRIPNRIYPKRTNTYPKRTNTYPKRTKTREERDDDRRI